MQIAINILIGIGVFVALLFLSFLIGVAVEWASKTKFWDRISHSHSIVKMFDVILIIIQAVLLIIFALIIILAFVVTFYFAGVAITGRI